MKSILTAFLVLTTAALAATEKAPASRISTVTNNYHILTGNVAQVNFNEIDGWLTNHSGRIDGATNLAQRAYDAATGGGLTNIMSLQEQFNHRTYVYTHTNVLEIANAVSGNTQFTVPTQSIGKVHVGMYLSNSPCFAVATMVTSVDWTNMIVGIDKTITNTVSSTSCVAVATGTATDVTFTHTVPSGYSRCKVTVTGSGGSGGNDNDGNATGTGGGAGGTAIAFLKLHPSSTYLITSGKIPANAAAGGDGTSGYVSSFGSIVSAFGGTKGTEADAALAGGAGGTSAGGTISVDGGSGAARAEASSSSPGGSSYWGGSGAAGSKSAYGAGGIGVWSGRETAGRAGSGVVIIEYY